MSEATSSARARSAATCDTSWMRCTVALVRMGVAGRSRTMRAVAESLRTLRTLPWDVGTGLLPKAFWQDWLRCTEPICHDASNATLLPVMHR